MNSDNCPVPERHGFSDKKVTLSISFKMWFGYLLAFGIACAAITYYAVRPVHVETKTEVVEAPDQHDPTQFARGWVDDPEMISAFNVKVGTPQFANTPAAKVSLGNEDRFLWRAVRLAGHFAGDAYPNVNQKNVGCCVGCGWKHTCDVAHAINIANGHPATWKPISVEVIYGGSRIEIGGGKMRSDGSVGAWAKEFVLTYGVVPMDKYDDADLTIFSPDRARSFGKSGVPKGIETVARLFPIKEAAQVRSADEGVKAIQQDYPIAVCSNVGFNNPDGTTGTRDSNGFIKARGSWAHCMCAIGYRTTPPGVFILNSWGDDAHKGGVYPPDQPKAGFWIDLATFDKMLKQGDSYAVSSVQGFPAKKLGAPDWFAKARGHWELNGLPLEHTRGGGYVTMEYTPKYVVSDNYYPLAP